MSESSSHLGTRRLGGTALVLATLLLVGGPLIASATHSELERTGPLIELAGRQRMLVQRLAGTGRLWLADPERRAELRGPLTTDLAVWNAGHDRLATVARAMGEQSDLNLAYAELQGPRAKLDATLRGLLESEAGTGVTENEFEGLATDYLKGMQAVLGRHLLQFQASEDHAWKLTLATNLGAALLVVLGGLALFRGRSRTGAADSSRPERDEDAAPANDLSGRLPVEHMRQLFVHAREGLVTATGDGTITYANPVAAQQFALPAEALVGKPLTLLEALAPGTESEGLLAHFLRTRGDELQAELRALRHGGTLFPAEVSLVRVEVGAEEVLLLVVREIVDRDQTLPELEAAAEYQRQRNRELEAHVRALEESTEQLSELETQVRHGRKLEAVGRLAGGIAHDFNNILSVLLCSNNRLRSVLKSADVSSELVAEPLEEIHNSCWKAASLTRQLLAFSRRQVLHPQVLSASSLLEGVEGMLRSALTEDIAFHVSSAHGLPNLRADPVHVEQVLVNLVLNARDALEGSGEIRVAADEVDLVDFVDIDAEAHSGRYVRIRVSDDGRGMDPKVLDLIFEPFFTTKPVGEGTGLGLASARGIVKQSGGFMAVESEPGVGTTFDVYLPAVDEEVTDPSEEAGTPPEEEPALVAGSGTILLCEDDEDLLRVTARTLQRAGYDVLAAPTPEHAVERAQEAEVDLLVTDLVMPGMSGRDLGERLRRDRPDLAIVYVSGYDEDVLDSHVGLDVDEDVLKKPYAAADLLGRVHDALDGRPAGA